MNEDKGYTIYCTRCGQPMKSTSRYCMKCGNLNYDHEANASMRPYLKENGNTYEVGAGKFIVDADKNKTRVSYANNTGSRKLCFWLNFSFYMFFMVLGVVLTVMQGVSSLDDLTNSPFVIFAFTFSLLFLYIYGIELMYMKANQRWWSALIPIYSTMVLSDMAFHSMLIGLLSFVPVIGPIFMLVLMYNLGNSFDKSGILTVLFAPIMIPIIGFDSSSYEGRTYVDSDLGGSVEEDYKLKKMFLTIMIVLLFLSIGLMVLSNVGGVNGAQKTIENYYDY